MKLVHYGVENSPVEQIKVVYVDIVLPMFEVGIFMKQRKFLINLMNTLIKAWVTAKKFISWSKALTKYKQTNIQSSNFFLLFHSVITLQYIRIF